MLLSHREVELLDFCRHCSGYKAPRSHHCGRCGRCVKRMDHHCPFLNACVGYENHSSFFYLIILASLALAHGVLPMAAAAAGFAGATGAADAMGYPSRKQRSSDFPGEKKICFFSFSESEYLRLSLLGFLAAFSSVGVATFMLLFLALLMYFQVRGIKILLPI